MVVPVEETAFRVLSMVTAPPPLTETVVRPSPVIEVAPVPPVTDTALPPRIVVVLAPLVVAVTSVVSATVASTAPVAAMFSAFVPQVVVSVFTAPPLVMLTFSMLVTVAPAAVVSTAAV